jgi:DNA invertase Pin-like site-specific DNA recombinase
MGEVVGYGRVSSQGQSLAVQDEKLKAFGCTRIYAEKTSGRQQDNRPQFQACLEFLRDGDTLVISRLDRMARSVLDLAKIADVLKRKGVTLKVLDQSIDTSTSEGKLMFSLLGAFAEFECDIRAERQSDGIAKAKSAGVTFGRKKALTDEQIKRVQFLRNEEKLSVPDIADRFNCGVATIYRGLSATPAVRSP